MQTLLVNPIQFRDLISGELRLPENLSSGGWPS